MCPSLLEPRHVRPIHHSPVIPCRSKSLPEALLGRMLYVRKMHNWADPGVLWKNAPRAIRAMRGKTLQTVPFKGISTVLWVHQMLPQSTVSQAFPSNKSYESKAGCSRTPATVLWVPHSIGVLSHHLKCETKSPHLVDLSWDFVDF